MPAVARAELLIPFLQAGLDVDGCDVSGDMLAYFQQAAERAGVAAHLYRHALHHLDLPRLYQTIVACGVFGLGGSRQQDVMALHRLYDHLVPGGVLLLEGYPAYSDAKLWPLWRKEARTHLPEAWPAEVGTRTVADQDYQLHYRLVAIDPLEQRWIGEMRMLLFAGQQVVADDTLTLTENYYFYHELRLLLEQVGFPNRGGEGRLERCECDGGP